ncbi:MAG: lactonase family protein, partial [Planctomycetes bacterium]|nr:lactonase family protein [Planctomycetota bacterium]
RDSATGLLTFVDNVQNDALYGAGSMAISPDGAHIYAGGYNAASLAVFGWDETTGSLEWVETLQDGVGGTTTINGVRSLEVSRDGAFVYAAAEYDYAVTVFQRDAVTGQLTPSSYVKYGYGGVPTLYGANGIVLSPDQRLAYVTSSWGSELGVFARDPASGQLSFLQVLKDNADGVDGLWYSRYVAISPDGRHVYATGESDDALAAFAVDAGLLVPRVHEVNLNAGQIREDVDFGNDRLPPQAISIVRSGDDPTNADTVDFRVTFVRPVTGVDVSDFAVAMTGSLAGAAPVSVSGSGNEYLVTVAAGFGEGTLRLDLVDDDSIVDDAFEPLGGIGPVNGDFTGDETFTREVTPPVVMSINRIAPELSNAEAVGFLVVFSESVTGVDATDFAAATTGSISGASVAEVSGNGSQYTVIVSTGAGEGAIRLDVVDDDSILDTAGNPLGGPTAGDGDYPGAVAYTLDRTPPSVTSIVRNQADPTGAAEIAFTVTFDSPVTGIDTSDFVTAITGDVSGA